MICFLLPNPSRFRSKAIFTLRVAPEKEVGRDGTPSSSFFFFYNLSFARAFHSLVSRALLRRTTSHSPTPEKSFCVQLDSAILRFSMISDNSRLRPCWPKLALFPAIFFSEPLHRARAFPHLSPTSPLAGRSLSCPLCSPYVYPDFTGLYE